MENKISKNSHNQYREKFQQLFFTKKTVSYFCLVSILGYLILLVRAFLTHGEVFSEVFFANGYFSMGDMLMHLSFVYHPENVYFANEQACFPPFAYLFYWILTRITPPSATPDMNYYRALPIFNLIYIMFMIVICCILAKQIQLMVEDKIKHTLCFALLILFSEPFWGSAIERGNSVLIALVLLMAAFLLRNSESKILRELALICIAMAAGFKIYPAIMGLLYIIEKRYKEAFRLMIYGLVVMFVPFVFFGGYAGFLQLLNNLSAVKSVEGSFYTISEIFYLLYKDFFHAETLSASVLLIGKLITVCYFLVAILISFLSKRNWVKVLFLTSLMVVFVPASYPYTTIYLLLPFVLFIKEAKEEKIDCFYSILFGLIFTIFAIPWDAFIIHYDISFCYIIRYLALYLMLIALIIQEIVIFFKNKKMSKN